MTDEQEKAKSDTALREEEVLKFWKDNKIFEKSLEKESPKGNFVFYDGPPFATGLPHYGSLLSSIIKDVVPRYKTMRGFRVRRKWGWDTHGLPIESLVEKKLGLKSKKDIEQIGVAKFNGEARAMVLQYAHDWQKYVERVGRWVEFENAYKTMDNSYIESVWWAISELDKKGLLYEGRKVLMYCPHCETPLAKAEIAMDNSYKDITEEAVTVKFKVKNPEKLGLKGEVFLLAWTTTPWTLPGNVALAVGQDIKYGVFDKEGQSFIKAEEAGDFFGKDLVGLEYEPLFDIPQIKESPKAYKVYSANFVNTEEGTGIVHTAVMYGEDDYLLGLKEGLPMVDLLDAGGKYNESAPESLRYKYIKKAEPEIKEYLATAGLLFDKRDNTHSYPHCYRCGTALIYNAVSSWFVNIQKIKEKLLKENENINWVPEYLKHGRFQNIIENAPDWTISRNRYWASPLPIWKNEKGEKRIMASVEDLKKYAQKSGNKYFAVRHGEGEHNVLDIVSNDPALPHHLTERGKEQARTAGEKLKKEKIDLIYCSPFVRTRETAEIIAEATGFPKEKIIYDDRIRELGFGDFHLKPFGDFLAYEESSMKNFNDKLPNGESYQDAKNRTGDFIYDIDSQYQNKNILIVTHGMFLEALPAVIVGADAKQSKNFVDTVDPQLGEVYEYDFVRLPHNENYELDLHKPYIDDIKLVEEDGKPLTRIKEVVDCWLESGSMSFAEWHYPTENKKEFEHRFPGDFIAEYIAQTRTWFYYMHVLSTALFGSHSFKNVVTTGNVLAKDGTKMSKSKGNYTDPLANFDQFGADALRLYMMGSVVMQAEDMSFRDEEYKEQHSRVINIFWNCLTFFKMYQGEEVLSGEESKLSGANVLDRWIITRLNQTIYQMTEAMESYNTVGASRTIKPFVDDFSTWYVRRSRDRFKSEDPEDRKNAMATTRFVLLTFSKLLAPIMPFISESVFREVRTNNDPESVHLCEWPEPSKTSWDEEEVLRKMMEVRKIVSIALERRNTAGLKVKQPLKELKINNPELTESGEYLGLIKDEVNVKEVAFDPNLETEVLLDTTITPELQIEGQTRELVRAIQDLRKQNDLHPSDLVKLSIETDVAGKVFVESVINEIKRPTNVTEIKFEGNEGGVIKIGEMTFKLSLLKADD